MTRKRLDKREVNCPHCGEYIMETTESTEFGLWLREQEELDSKKGYTATNLDYIWRNYKTRKFMLIEEKRYNSEITHAQQTIFNVIKSICKKDGRYRGFHKLTFEKTNPEDGKIFLNDKEISKEELLSFLKFEGVEHRKYIPKRTRKITDNSIFGG